MPKDTRYPNAKTAANLLPAVILGVGLFVSCLFGGTLGGADAQGQAMDLSLALAVDASGSVDDDEFALQLQGIAAAFRDPAVHEAVTAGPASRIAVSLVVWADHQSPKDESGWFMLGNARDMETFARVVESFPAARTAPPGLEKASPRPCGL